VRAHAFEDVEDGDVFAAAVGLLEVAGRDAAPESMMPGMSRRAMAMMVAGHVLVAAGDADDAVEEVAAGYEFDGVGNDFAGDERGFHALRCPW